MNKYVYKQYKSGYIPTIGTDFLVKELFLDDKTVSLQLWDTSGQERFLSLGVSFYRGSDGCILVYDVNTYESFLNLQKWREEFLKYASPDDPDNFPFIVIGNKSDLSEDLIVKFKLMLYFIGKFINLFRLDQRKNRKKMVQGKQYTIF